MNKYTLITIAIAAVTALALTQTTFPSFVFAQAADHDEHAGHDHPATAAPNEDTGQDHDTALKRTLENHADHDDEEASGHDDHNDHGGGEADSHDDHAGHDDEEEGAIRIDSATMKEYGIVVHEAGPGSLEQTLRLPGEVVFNADRIAHVAPSVSGIVQAVNHSVGDRVDAGEVMAVLSSRDLAAARSEYVAALARLTLAQENLSAKKDLYASRIVLAEENLARDERLLEGRVGTERQVLEARQTLREIRIGFDLEMLEVQQTIKEAQISMNQAESALHALGQSEAETKALVDLPDTALGEYEMRAPLDGIVIARELTHGEVVSEQPGEVPFIIADLSSVWVNLTVYQRDLIHVRAGMRVQIEVGHGIPDASGTIAFVSPALDEATRTATARIVLDNPDGLWRPGMFIKGIITTDTYQSALVLPRSALQEIEGRVAVFVQTEDGFEVRPVQIGRETDAAVEVAAGLKPGERVVVRNGFALKAEMSRGTLEHAGHAH
ncbi:MAG: hypothetical protein CMJ19_16060 [Phycisphaeraceae bacterium]|nr:hypothetical protein [Phycisphaeraceae bacterium]|tara:strand:+ start:7453 stop:8940 length:1488 start_codon:yes stop_codon:yes gene_type:complete